MKQNINLTEKQLRQVVKESVSRILKEQQPTQQQANQQLMQNSLMTQYSPQEIIKIFQNWIQQNPQLPQENKQALQQAITFLSNQGVACTAKQPEQQPNNTAPAQTQPNTIGTKGRINTKGTLTGGESNSRI